MNDFRTATLEKYKKLVDRLTAKVKNSATPIKGFVVGLSGTDSVITYMLLQDVMCNIPFTVTGVHYVDDYSKPSSFQKNGSLDFVKSLNPESNIIVQQLPNGNHDQFRWADMHYNAANQCLWVVSTMNATEKALGNYSIMNKSASIAPIQSLYKSEIITLCRAHGVPEALIELSELPDCLCGRDEFAAQNIQLIDAVIRNDFGSITDLEKLKQASQYVKNMKRDNDFKNRTPYNV